MKRYILSLLGVVSMVLATAAVAADRSSPAPAAAKLIVHEWGTFTGFAGSDGVHLPFRSTVGAELPSFVLTRLQQQLRVDPKGGALLLDFGKGEIFAMQRMETPVVYFYADSPREVEARVDFHNGKLTEFYPPVRAMTPAYNPATEGKFQDSSLDWGKIRILPGEAGTRVPKVEGTNTHYAHARATDSALVQFSDKPGEVHEEKFLFYRGLGDFTLPVALAATGNDQFVLVSNAEDPVAFAFLIRIENGKVQFATYRNLRGRQELTLPPKDSTPGNLGEAVAKALVAEGLYEKEARAMVKTWESSWFAEQGTGTRLLYAVPRKVTDALLPLKINPTPDETVRVLVGRIDIMTPEQEARFAAMITKADTKGAIGKDEAREAKALGRFFYPAFERVGKIQATKAAAAVRATPD